MPSSEQTLPRVPKSLGLNTSLLIYCPKPVRPVVVYLVTFGGALFYLFSGFPILVLLYGGKEFFLSPLWDSVGGFDDLCADISFCMVFNTDTTDLKR